MDAPAPFKERRITTWDGLEVSIRAIRREDSPRLQDIMQRMSTETRRLRFFTPWRELPSELAERLANVDFVSRAALVATLPGDDAVRAIARYDVTGDGEAEMAFAVEDEFQGHGIATEMLHLLAGVARDNGIRTFVGTTLAENATMLAVFRDSGYPMTVKPQHEVLEIRLDVTDEPGRAKTHP